MKVTDKMREYWSRNLKVTAVLLAIWFVFSYVLIILAPSLHNVNFIGFPLSFYMAAQGTLIVYVVIIFYYARKMNQLDNEYGVQEEE